ncbi:putative adenosine deaminase 2 (Adenosine aminohydrolase 2), partial [Reticulomyxa filosa]
TIGKHVAIEYCLTSNIGGKVKDAQSHPIYKLINHDFQVTLNTDNLLLSGNEHLEANPTNEILQFITSVSKIRDTDGGKNKSKMWSIVKSMLINGIKHSFDKNIDNDFVQEIEQEIDQVLSTELNVIHDDKTKCKL